MDVTQPPNGTVDIVQGGLELLFTVKEETGLLGAFAFDHTRLRATRGFVYDSSLQDDDVPYLMTTSGPGSAELLEIPVDWALDDWEQFAFYPGWTGSGIIESPTKALEMWSLEATTRHAEGGCFVLTTHPFLSGRPAKADALEHLIEFLRSLEGMWVTSLAEIAAHARPACGPARTHERLTNVPV